MAFLVLLTSMVPVLASSCRNYLPACSAACGSKVEHAECWGSPQCSRCICADGTDKSSEMPSKCESSSCGYSAGQGACPVSGGSCPAHSSSSGAGECTCDAGYAGTIIWDAKRGAYVGDCAHVECPAHSRGSMGMCACDDGYKGHIAWDSKNFAYTGTCVQVYCPDGAIHPDGQALCQCGPGWRGPCTWNANFQDYDGGCVNVDCPPNTEGTGTGSCECKIGSSGDLAWDYTNWVWTGTCNVVSCPAHSSSSGAGECTCDAGYAGTITWDAKNGTYVGECGSPCRNYLLACSAACGHKPEHAECWGSPQCSRCICADGTDKSSEMPSKCESSSCGYSGQGGCPGSAFEGFSTFMV